MIEVDLDFAKYVSQRRGQVEQRARDGSAYAYAGEQKVRRALTSARPVAIAIEGTTRLWKGKAKNELAERGERATDQVHPRLREALGRAARALSLTAPPAFVVPTESRGAVALGTDADPVILVDRGMLEKLDDDELTALCARELAHIQNNHVLYATSLYYLEHDAIFFVRWIVKPALMALQAWSRRAEITCDRAALLAVRKLDTVVSMELRLRGEDQVDTAAYLADLPERGMGKYADLFRSHPTLPTRVRALREFAGSRFYRAFCGDDDPSAPGAADVDDKVSEIISVF